MSLQTEYPFALPKGFVDQHGSLHRDGVMRLATARDEIEPLRDAEGLFVADLAYLQDFYRAINFQDEAALEAVKEGPALEVVASGGA